MLGMLPALSLPANVDRALGTFVEAARSAFGEHLISILLFGSAAEGRIRATSDVNVIVVLSEFVPEQVKAFSPAAVLARAAVRLQPMFLLSTEISAAAECFAPKFADILRRHQVLYGSDVLANIEVPRDAQIARLRQVLLNLALRLRASYVDSADREDQIAVALADAAGPLRTSAATLLELESGTVLPPREALWQIAEASTDARWRAALATISAIREKKPAPGSPSEALFAVIDVADHLRRRVEALA
jgi:predicted nucleotidyltransferase